MATLQESAAYHLGRAQAAAELASDDVSYALKCLKSGLSDVTETKLKSAKAILARVTPTHQNPELNTEN